MNQLCKLLEDKNYWYKKYLACTEAFVTALRHAPDVALDEIELFYGNRESLLKILANLDGKIQEIVGVIEKNGQEPNSDQSTKIKFQLREKDSIIEKIVQLDKEMMLEIETLRVKSEEKLKLLAKGKKALANYKSGSKQAERIDGKA